MHYGYCETENNELVNAWTMFKEIGAVPKDILHPDNYISWVRCSHKGIYGMPLPANKRAKKQNNRSLIDNAQQVMNVIDTILTEHMKSEYSVILMDAEGVIIKTKGNDVIPWVNHGSSETYACLNAMDIATNENKVLEIYGYEHLYPESAEWHTLGAPIFNYDKSVAGGLGIICQTSKVSSIVPIVRIGSQLIQSVLVFEQIAAHQMGVLLEEISDAAIATNELGVILDFNQKFMDLCIPFKISRGHYLTEYIEGNINYHTLLNTCDKSDVPSKLYIKGKDKIHHMISMKKCVISSFGDHSLLLFIVKAPHSNDLKILSSAPLIDNKCYHFEDLYGDSGPINKVKTIARKAAESCANVLIEGETGTGKELIAQSIHSASRPTGPFIAINCGSLTKELLQSELFGYEEGAFTGAIKGGKPGKFELADGGSIFLDEIGEMPLEMQVSLLRCLQEKTVTRVGGTLTRKVNVRIIAATNRVLDDEVKNGNFREDLYYRLNVIEIRLPSLREHIQDLPSLSRHILDKFCQERNTNEHIEISAEAMECLSRYDWPGNVRELQNVMERAIIYMEGNVITYDCLPPRIKESVLKDASDKGSLLKCEKIAITQAIRKHHGNLSKTAEELGIARSTLYQKMDKLCISH
ncbi:AAA family ATPase [Desulfosporosinus fructosivorans]|uniref:AAA family ATPase n=1 Tax=Desulfosporosinus fructosivorans TaxID=2018669 RepID=A0A4Z0R1R2_9FIRM|nr:sigma 54-interacting transcriptional regulator [Desulfosporosinus fructosivorans]TGE37012.1 AAA family ATPase [Desulfosporosinus fructosivorans]